MWPPTVGLGDSAYVRLETDIPKDTFYEPRLSFAPDGLEAIGRANDGIWRIWRLTDGQEQQRLPWNAHSIAYTNQGPRAFVVTDANEIEVRDCNTGILIHKTGPLEGGLRKIVLSVDDRFLMTTTGDVVGACYRHPGAQTFDDLVFIEESKRNSLVENAYRRDGTAIAEVGEDSSLHIIDLKQQQVHSFSFGMELCSDISPLI